MKLYEICNAPFDEYGYCDCASANTKDDIAVDAFAKAMKEKLAIAREKGRSGWDNKETCSANDLAQGFWKHTRKDNKGNFIALANFLMFLHVRGEHASKLCLNAPCCNTCGNVYCFNAMHRFNNELDLGIMSCRFWYGKEVQ